MKKRYFAKRPKGLPKGYDSHFEVSLHENELKGCNHHPERLAYTSSHTYQPDFISIGNPYILIEAKGRMRDSQESSKYKHIRDSNPDYEIVFLLEKPNLPMPFAKVRKKCGTKQTHAQWCEHNGFRWFTRDTIKEVL